MIAREPLELHVFVIFIPVFACFWLFVSSMIAEFSGWKAMAQRYRATRRPAGIRYFWRSMRLSSFAGYNSCLNITLSPDGVYMVPSLLFRFGHAPLLIPWERIGEILEKKFIFRRCYLPIHAADRELQLHVPCSARDWIDRHARQTA